MSVPIGGGGHNNVFGLRPGLGGTCHTPGVGQQQVRWITPRRRFKQEVEKMSPVWHRAQDILFYRTEALVGVAIGGLVATATGVGYYMYQQGRMEELLSRTDRIRLERAQDKDGSGFSLPLPLLTFLGWTAFAVLTAIVAKTKANLDLNFRQFSGRVNFSLNTVRDGRLKFRTVQEKSLESVLLGNSAALAVVRQAIKRVTEQDPFLRFPPTDNFFMMNAILNDLSPLSSTAFFQADRYPFCSSALPLLMKMWGGQGGDWGVFWSVVGD